MINIVTVYACLLISGGTGSNPTDEGPICPKFILADRGGQHLLVSGTNLDSTTTATINGLAVNCVVIGPNRAIVECPALSAGTHELQVTSGSSSIEGDFEAREPGELDPVFVINCLLTELEELAELGLITQGFASSVSAKLAATRDSVLKGNLKEALNNLNALRLSLQNDSSFVAFVLQDIRSTLLVPPILGDILAPTLHLMEEHDKSQADPKKQTTKEWRDATAAGLKKAFGITIVNDLSDTVKDPSDDTKSCGTITVDEGKFETTEFDKGKFSWGCFYATCFVPNKDESWTCKRLEFILCKTRKCDPKTNDTPPNQDDVVDGPTSPAKGKKSDDPTVKTQVETSDGICMHDAPSLVNPWQNSKGEASDLVGKKLTCTWDLKVWLVCADKLPLADPHVFGYVQIKITVEFTKVGKDKDETVANGVTVTCKKEDKKWVKAGDQDIRHCLRDYFAWQPKKK